MLTHSIMWIRATRAETCAKCSGKEHLPTKVQFVAGVRDGARCWRQRWRTQKCGFGQRARQHARNAVEGSWRPVTGQSHVSVELHIFACVPFCPLVFSPHASPRHDAIPPQVFRHDVSFRAPLPRPLLPQLTACFATLER